MGAFVAVLLLLGLPVGLYQSPLAAIRRHITKDSPLRVFAHPLASRAAEEAAAGRLLRHGLPADAVIQAHWGTERLELAQIARKQIGVTVLEQDTMVFFPTDAAAHRQALQAIEKTLAHPTSAARCHQTLRQHGITHVFVGTIEREHWQGFEKFTDQRYFECVLEDNETAVYALRSILAE